MIRKNFLKHHKNFTKCARPFKNTSLSSSGEADMSTTLKTAARLMYFALIYRFRVLSC